MNSAKVYLYKIIALGGTFDLLHLGHKHFLSRAFALAEKVIIGLTSDEYVRRSKIKDQRSKRISEFKIRKAFLISYLKKKAFLDNAQILKINDIYGPAIKPDGGIQALAATEETRLGAEKINRRRRRLGLKNLDIKIISYVKADDGKPISSSRIRLGVIERQGKLYRNLSTYKGAISPRLRKDLKMPLGILLKGNLQSPNSLIIKLRKSLAKTNNSIIITVGDEVTTLCNRFGIGIDLAIIDFKIKRKKVYDNLSDLGFRRNKPDFLVENPRGFIRSKMISAIDMSLKEIVLKGKQQIIKVNGEEDLAGIPAILLAPLGSVVMYGQPGGGLVIVRVSEDRKKHLIRLLKD